MTETSIQPQVAIIGGSGFYEFPELKNQHETQVKTPFGDVFGVVTGQLNGVDSAFLLRHGAGHRLPPHKVNYRANIWALHSLGVKKIFAINAVGGISGEARPGSIVLPDQIVDYTYCREHTFADLLSDDINHIDFTYPFCQRLRELLATSLADSEVDWVAKGTYACMQGPRLETSAEIDRLERDGCSVVGMTAMPEAALARELRLDYASLCIVANWAAGRSSDLISIQDIHAILEKSAASVRKVLLEVVKSV